jgi:hypothetical protein
VFPSRVFKAVWRCLLVGSVHPLHLGSGDGEGQTPHNSNQPGSFARVLLNALSRLRHPEGGSSAWVVSFQGKAGERVSIARFRAQAKKISDTDACNEQNEANHSQH